MRNVTDAPWSSADETMAQQKPNQNFASETELERVCLCVWTVYQLKRNKYARFGRIMKPERLLFLNG